MSENAAKRPKVLLVHPVTSTCRLIRESLDHFCGVDVETCADARRGFELALQREYEIYLFGLSLKPMEGPLLYDLIVTAYSFSHEGKHVAPAVIYIADEGEKIDDDFAIDARVKGVLRKPINIERLLQMTRNSLRR